jgi:hypothetical protein
LSTSMIELAWQRMPPLLRGSVDVCSFLRDSLDHTPLWLSWVDLWGNLSKRDKWVWDYSPTSLVGSTWGHVPCGENMRACPLWRAHGDTYFVESTWGHILCGEHMRTRLMWTRSHEDMSRDLTLMSHTMGSWA